MITKLKLHAASLSQVLLLSSSLRQLTFVLGSSGSGKTTLTSKILANPWIFDKQHTKIIYCYHDYQPNLFGNMKKQCPQIEFMQGIPETFGEEGSSEPTLIV